MSIPLQMVATVAGIGEFVIKCSGLLVVTCLAGACATEMCYEHKKGMFWVAYEGIEGRRSCTSPKAGGKFLSKWGWWRC